MACTDHDDLWITSLDGNGFGIYPCCTGLGKPEMNLVCKVGVFIGMKSLDPFSIELCNFPCYISKRLHLLHRSSQSQYVSLENLGSQQISPVLAYLTLRPKSSLIYKEHFYLPAGAPGSPPWEPSSAKPISFTSPCLFIIIFFPAGAPGSPP